MFKIGDKVKTNSIWNETYGCKSISGVITGIRKYSPQKLRWRIDIHTGMQVPEIQYGQYDPEMTLLTIDGNKEHEMNETLFELDE